MTPVLQPTAVYLGLQERVDLPPLALYTIRGGPYDRSTVTADKLVALGIAVPA
jgi:hypothetical protein